MRRSRAAYHYAIRRIRKSEAEIVRDRIAESMLNNKSRDMQRIIQDVNNMVTGCFRFYVCDIRTAVGHMKPHKIDGCIRPYC